MDLGAAGDITSCSQMSLWSDWGEEFAEMTAELVTGIGSTRQNRKYKCRSRVGYKTRKLVRWVT